MRKHGLTVDNLLSVDLVTADAERLHVDAETEPELFWGLRGGGGNFGIATAFEYRLHPVGPIVLGGPIFWPLDRRAGGAAVPPRLRPRGARRARHHDRDDARAADAVPAARAATASRSSGSCSSGPATRRGPAGDRAAARASARRSPTSVRPVPYVALQSMLDGGAPHGRHYYWKSHRLPDLSDEVIDVLVERVDAITSPFSQIDGWAVGGAVSRVDPGRDGGRRARGRVRAQHRRGLAPVRPRRRAPHGLGARGVGGAAPAQRRRLRQLPLRRGRRRRRGRLRRRGCSA